MRKSNPTNANAVQQHGEGTKQNTHNNCILAELSEIIKTSLFAGELVHASDFPISERAHYHAAMAELKDSLPIRTRWRTKTESALGDWKLRQRCYALPAELVTHPKGGEV